MTTSNLWHVWWTSHLNQPSFKVQGYTGCGLLAAVSSEVTRSRRCTSSLSNSPDSHDHHCGPFLEKLARNSRTFALTPFITSPFTELADQQEHVALKERCCDAATCWTKKVALKILTFDPTAAGQLISELFY